MVAVWCRVFIAVNRCSACVGFGLLSSGATSQHLDTAHAVQRAAYTRWMRTLCVVVVSTTKWLCSLCGTRTYPTRTIACCALQVKKAAPYEQPASSSAPSQAEDIAIGKLRGEDYNFEFQGKPKDGKMHFRLFMTQVRTNTRNCTAQQVLAMGACGLPQHTPHLFARTSSAGLPRVCREWLVIRMSMVAAAQALRPPIQHHSNRRLCLLTCVPAVAAAVLCLRR